MRMQKSRETLVVAATIRNEVWKITKFVKQKLNTRQKNIKKGLDNQTAEAALIHSTF